MKSYKDLDIYVEFKRLAIEIHKLTLTLPKFELFEEGSQVRRSSKAITSLIVEGYGRKRYKADFIKYLVYSHAECDETMVHLEFLQDTESFKNTEKSNQLINDYISLSKK
jgi:four helix bundle protein